MFQLFLEFLLRSVRKNADHIDGCDASTDCRRAQAARQEPTARIHRGREDHALGEVGGKDGKIEYADAAGAIGVVEGLAGREAGRRESTGTPPPRRLDRR